MRPEFDYIGNRYRFDGIPAMVETRIARRMAPLVALALGTMLKRQTKPGKLLELRPDANLVKFIDGVLNRVGALPDDDTDMVQREALRGLSRQMGDEWHPVWSDALEGPAFADIDGAVVMGLTLRSLSCVIRNWLSHSDEINAAFANDMAGILH